GGHLREAADLSVKEIGERTWIVGDWQPPELHAAEGAYTIVAALDITDVESLVHRNLVIATSVIGLAALISIVLAWRLASTMSNALVRVSDAHRKLQAHEYVQVTGVSTGDELELLADGFNTMVEGLKERDRMRTTFGKYMTASVLEHLLAGR